MLMSHLACSIAPQLYYFHAWFFVLTPPQCLQSFMMQGPLCSVHMPLAFTPVVYTIFSDSFPWEESQVPLVAASSAQQCHARFWQG